MARSATSSVEASGRPEVRAARTSAPPSALLAARTAIPRRATGTVVRPALDRRLDEAIAHRLTVVSAGPGWGKTTAVAAWASAQQDLPVAWLTLESQDDTPSVFWREVLDAVVLSGALPSRHPLREVDPAGAVSPEVLRAVFRGFESLPAPLVLVLDDFHVLGKPEVLESVESLVRYQLPVRLVVITRMDPALRLHRLRVAGELAELSAADLAFDDEDVQAMAAAESRSLPADEAAQLVARTEGWPAGVRLAMIYLSRSGAGGIAGFAGGDRSVAEYLVAEVLERQTPEMRDFLVRTSVVSPVCAELAEALAPDHPAQVRLEELARGNHFVTVLGPQGRWYRYHPLLREMLVGLARREDPQGYRDAHREAARWLATHEEPVRALRHAADAEDWSLFSAVFVESGAAALIGPDREAVESLLEGIPYPELPPSAALEVCAAGLATMRGRPAAARGHVDRARALLPENSPQLAAIESLTAVFDAGSSRGLGDLPRIVPAARAALQALDRADWPFPAMPAYRTVAVNNLGVGLLWTGDVEGAREAFARVLDSLPPAGPTLPEVNALSYLALCDLVEGRLSRASARAAEALDAAARRGWATHLQLRPAHLVLALVRVVRGDPGEADLALASATAADFGGEEPVAALLSRVVQTFIAVSRGRIRAAEHALQAAHDAAEGWPPGSYLADQLRRAETDVRLLAAAGSGAPVPEPDVPAGASTTELVCRARVLLAAGDTVGADEVAGRVTSSGAAAAGVDLVTLVEAWLVRSIAAHRLRRDREALQALGHALDLSRPEGVVRPFVVMADDRLSALLRLHASVHVAPDDFTKNLAEHVSGAEDVGVEPEPLLVPLTDRELAVLAALPSMQSNAEIAAEYFVSVNTVKAHLKALYRKLGVSSRREAVRRGRELGLLA
jgi:LuxR family transcriptional regulator, maltose regulon positive regulatory protein